MIARLLFLTSVLVGCLTAVSGNMILLRKNGKLQGRLRVEAEEGIQQLKEFRAVEGAYYWAFPSMNPKFFMLGPVGDVVSGNAYAVEVSKERGWHLGENKAEPNDRCEKSVAYINYPETSDEYKSRKELKTDNVEELVFYLCPGKDIKFTKDPIFHQTVFRKGLSHRPKRLVSCDEDALKISIWNTHVEYILEVESEKSDDNPERPKRHAGQESVINPHGVLP